MSSEGLEGPDVAPVADSGRGCESCWSELAESCSISILPRETRAPSLELSIRGSRPRSSLRACHLPAPPLPALGRSLCVLSAASDSTEHVVGACLDSAERHCRVLASTESGRKTPRFAPAVLTIRSTWFMASFASAFLCGLEEVVLSSNPVGQWALT